MSCESRIDDIALYVYGELAPEDEERLEAHADQCEACTREIARTREVGRALDGRHLDPSAALLAECRQELMIAVHSQPTGAGLLQGLRGLFGGWFEPAAGLRRLAAAAALVAIGFAASRLSMVKPSGIQPPGPATLVESTPAAAGFAVSGIHTVSNPSGEDKIVLDGTRTDQVSGPANDEQIMKYLLTAATEAPNPGVRVESVEILKDHPGSAEVRQTLVQALRDPNPGVRLMALQGLKPVATEADVHRALKRTLLADDNPGVRIQVMEILIERKDHDLVGVFQDLVQKEENGYVKIQVQKTLHDMNASEGHF